MDGLLKIKVKCVPDVPCPRIRNITLSELQFETRSTPLVHRITRMSKCKKVLNLLDTVVVVLSVQTQVIVNK